MKRTITIVGCLALMSLASVASADPLTCASSGNANEAAINSTLAPGGTAYCGAYTGGASATQGSSFASTSGLAYLDTINWQVNPPDGTGPNTGYYSPDGVPEYFNSNGQGNSGLSYASPPYGGGVNGTGYSFGTLGSLGSNPQGLTLTTTFGGMTAATGATSNTGPTNASNMLTGSLTGSTELGLTWDTSTTSPTSAPINGVGFDIQLLNPNLTQNTNGFTVTFNVYGATPGCSTSLISGSDPGPQTIDCFDYLEGEMTGATNPGTDSSQDTGSATDQLLGQVTISSANGAPVFFGFTTTYANGIGAIVETTDNIGPNEGNGDANFAIDDVTLLTAPASSTPEPATLLLFGSGLLIAARRLRKHATK